MIFWIERNDNARHYVLMPDAGLAQAVDEVAHDDATYFVKSHDVYGDGRDAGSHVQGINY